MTSTDERRRFTRVKFDTAATVAQGSNAYHAQVLDISLNGVLLKTPEDYELRADLPSHISIFLSEDTEIQMQVTLAHSSNRYLGFHCESVDMDSIVHLRRLIELNMDDERAAERVLEEMVPPF